MGTLGKLKYRDVVPRLRKLGFEHERNSRGSHEVWVNIERQCHVVVPCHPGNINENTVRAILKQAGISVEEFLST